MFVNPVAAGPEMGLLVGLLMLSQDVYFCPNMDMQDEASGFPERLRTDVFSTIFCAPFLITVDKKVGFSRAIFSELETFRRLALTSPPLTFCMDAGEGHLGGEGVRGCFVRAGNAFSETGNESETQ